MVQGHRTTEFNFDLLWDMSTLSDINHGGHFVARVTRIGIVLR